MKRKAVAKFEEPKLKCASRSSQCQVPPMGLVPPRLSGPRLSSLEPQASSSFSLKRPNHDLFLFLRCFPRETTFPPHAHTHTPTPIKPIECHLLSSVDDQKTQARGLKGTSGSRWQRNKNKKAKTKVSPRLRAIEGARTLFVRRLVGSVSGSLGVYFYCKRLLGTRTSPHSKGCRCNTHPLTPNSRVC